MKMKILGIAACALALCFALVGCTQKTTDFTWYQAAVPDGYEMDGYYGDNAAKARFLGEDGKKEIQVEWNGVKDAQGICDAFLEWEGSGAEQLDDMKLGNYTWKATKYVSSSFSRIQFCTDLPNGLVGIVDTRGFTEADDKVLQDFVKSVKFVDNLQESYEKAKEISINDLKG